MAVTMEGGKNICAVLRAKGDLQLVSKCIHQSVNKLPELVALHELESLALPLCNKALVLVFLFKLFRKKESFPRLGKEV